MLGVAEKTARRWLANPYPPNTVSRTDPRVRAYALPEIVTRLRLRKKEGLDSAELLRLVAFDTEVRAARAAEEIWVGEEPINRAALFYSSLLPEEKSRAIESMAHVRRAATSCGLSGVEGMAKMSLIHPAIVRFILSGQANELPVGDAGWQSFAKAIWAVNPNEIYEAAA